MAINIQKKDDDKKFVIEMDNGHVNALKQITKDYNIRSESDAIGFMFSVFLAGAGKSVEVDGKSFVPSKNILNPINHGEECE